MDKTVGEAESSFGYTVLGDGQGQAICLAILLRQG